MLRGKSHRLFIRTTMSAHCHKTSTIFLIDTQPGAVRSPALPAGSHAEVETALRTIRAEAARRKRCIAAVPQAATRIDTAP